MGYTHYWKQRRPFTMGEWNRIMQRARRAIDEAQERAKRLETFTGKGKIVWDVEINKERIFFNGGCETFVLTRGIPERPDYYPQAEWEKWNSDGVMSFCKTRRAAYDPVVVEVLRIAYLASGADAINLSSDGDAFEDLLEEQ